MYCPRCGQQQLSDEMKFCSRCGLPMSGLAEWLDSAGAPAGRKEKKPGASKSSRRKGIRRGAKLMFLSGVMFPVFLVFSLIIDEGAPMIFPVIVFFIALTIMLYSRFFEEIPTIESPQTQTFGIGAMSRGSALPPASSIPIHGPGNLPEHKVRTTELAQPPSVTENTTKLLDQE